MRSLRMLCLVVAVGLGTTSVASAQPDAVTTGQQQYRDKDFRGALASFESADAASPSPALARYIGLCHDQLGEFAAAVTAYERYLQAEPAPKDQAAYDAVKARVAQLRAAPGKVVVTSTPPGAIVHVDGAVGGKTTPTELTLPPGAHTLAFDHDGYTRLERSVDVAFASSQDLAVELTASPTPQTLPPQPPLEPLTPPVAPPSPTKPGNKAAACVLGSVAVVGLGLGVGFGVAALGKKSDYDAAPTEARAATAEKLGLVADIAFGVAFVTGVTSLVLFLRDGTAPANTAPTATATSRFVAAPFVGREGSGVVGAFRF